MEGKIRKAMSAADAIPLVSAALMAASPSDRKSIAERAVFNTRGLSSVSIPNILSIAKNTDVTTAAKLLQQLMLQGAYVAQYFVDQPNATVADIMTIIQADAAGTPISGDALSPEVALTLPTVAAVLSAPLVAPDLKEDALQVCKDIAQAYDCHEHQIVLGGSPFSGGLGSALADAIYQNTGIALSKETRDARKQARQQYAADKSANTILDAVSNSTTGQATDIEGLKDALSSVLSHDVTSSSDFDAIASNYSERISNLKKSVAESVAQAKAAQDTAAEKSRDAARLAWAGSILSSSDDIADALSQVEPSLTSGSTSQFVGQIISLLTSLQESNDATTAAAVNSAIRDMSLTSPSLWSRLKGIFGGDPAWERVFELAFIEPDHSYDEFFESDPDQPTLKEL